MKVKIFMDDDKEYLENRINEWLKTSNYTDIKAIKQTQSSNTNAQTFITITIFYIEKE